MEKVKFCLEKQIQSFYPPQRRITTHSSRPFPYRHIRTLFLVWVLCFLLLFDLPVLYPISCFFTLQNFPHQSIQQALFLLIAIQYSTIWVDSSLFSIFLVMDIEAFSSFSFCNQYRDKHPCGYLSVSMSEHLSWVNTEKYDSWIIRYAHFNF